MYEKQEGMSAVILADIHKNLRPVASMSYERCMRLLYFGITSWYRNC